MCCVVLYTTTHISELRVMPRFLMGVQNVSYLSPLPCCSVDLGHSGAMFGHASIDHIIELR